MEEVFHLADGDMVTEVLIGVPSIIFSSRVQEYIDRRMTKTVIIKMLGGRLGFNALLNKITSLWSPVKPIQLMDLENNFYLVRLQDEEDYNRVVVRGPWIIFERYLTDRPWSSDFSTNQSEIDMQVVWIRLPGLPKRYYSDCLLRAIGQTIGRVVKLDANIVCARWGRFAHLVVRIDLRKPLI